MHHYVHHKGSRFKCDPLLKYPPAGIQLPRNLAVNFDVADRSAILLNPRHAWWRNIFAYLAEDTRQKFWFSVDAYLNA